MRISKYFTLFAIAAVLGAALLYPMAAQALSAFGGGGGSGGGSITTLTGMSPVPTSVATATTVPFDLSAGINRTVTLNASGSAWTCSNPTAGLTYKWKIIQGSGGSFTIASWCSSTNWRGGTTGGGGAPTLSTAAASFDIIVCYYDGADYDCDVETGFVP